MRWWFLPVALLAAPALGLAAQDPEPEPDPAESGRIGRLPPPGEGPWRVEVLTSRRARLGVTVNMRARETDSIGALLQSVTPNGPAARAGLIYFMEPVFATLFSVLSEHDEVTARLLVGGLLILLGNLLVELPAWRRQE